MPNFFIIVIADYFAALSQSEPPPVPFQLMILTLKNSMAETVSSVSMRCYTLLKTFLKSH